MVTLANIEHFLRKKIKIMTDNLNRVVEAMVNDGVIQKQGEI